MSPSTQVIVKPLEAILKESPEKAGRVRRRARPYGRLSGRSAGTGSDAPDRARRAANRAGLALAEGAMHLFRYRLRQVAEHGAASGFEEDLRGHPGHELQAAQPFHFLLG